MFRDGKRWTEPGTNHLEKYRLWMRKRKIEPIVHFSVEIVISTGKNINRLSQKVWYAQQIEAKSVLIHCGTRKGE